MTKEEIIKLLRGYEGTIIERENEILFQGFNTFEEQVNVYNPITFTHELQPRKRTKLCTLEFNLKRNSFDGNIDQNEGFSYPTIIEEDVEKALERYKFKKREMVQMNLFEDFK